MPTEPKRVYWDSCVYIHCIQHDDESRYEILDAIVEQAVSGEIVFVASSLVVAEVVKFDSPSQSTAEQAETIRQFFENPYIKVRGVTRKIAEDAAHIARTTTLKPPDAIHVATALDAGCDVMQTYDGESGEARKLLRFDGEFGVPALPIKMPYVIGDELTLFSM